MVELLDVVNNDDYNHGNKDLNGDDDHREW